MADDTEHPRRTPDTPYGRAAQLDEIAPSFVSLASNRLSSYYSGEVLAPIGGYTMPG